MKALADLLFESRMLKDLPRSGYPFLGNGRESVAEHVYSASMIALVMSRLQPGIDALRLISMCLVHDLAEARTGDLNYVQRRYVSAAESAALSDALAAVPFGDDLKALVDEFNAGRSHEARLARDADQLSFILELKTLSDRGYRPADKWLPYVLNRLQTDLGRELAESIMATASDGWWMDGYTETTSPDP
jgi:putative hydrolase of HD superfamily